MLEYGYSQKFEKSHFLTNGIKALEILIYLNFFSIQKTPLKGFNRDRACQQSSLTTILNLNAISHGGPCAKSQLPCSQQLRLHRLTLGELKLKTQETRVIWPITLLNVQLLFHGPSKYNNEMLEKLCRPGDLNSDRTPNISLLYYDGPCYYK